MKPLRKKHFPLLRQKLTQILPQNLLKGATIYLMNHIFQASVLIMECTELNWLCKHIKKIRSSQPSIPVLNWVKCLSSLFLWVSLSNTKKVKLLTLCMHVPTYSHFIYTLFYKQNFYKQRSAEIGKKSSKCSEAELSLFENYSDFSSTLSSKSRPRYGGLYVTCIYNLL